MPLRTRRRGAPAPKATARGFVLLVVLLVAPQVGWAPGSEAAQPVQTRAFAVGQNTSAADTWLLLANAGPDPATARLTLLPDNAAPVSASVAIDAGSRQGVYLNPLLPDA